MKVYLIVGAVVAMAWPVAGAAELETPTYLVPQTTFATASGRLTTPSYLVDTSVGQPGITGVQTTSGFVIESGFFTSGSTDPVPVELMRFEIVSTVPDGHEATSSRAGSSGGDR